MAFSTDYYDIYRKILNTDDYLKFLEINDQIEYATQLTEDERKILEEKYTETLSSKFLYPDCKSIEEILVPYKNDDYTRYSYEDAERKCTFAKELNMTMADYMLRIENNKDFTIKINPIRSTGNAQEVIKRMNRTGSAINRDENLSNIDSGIALRDMELGIDTELANNQKIDELAESINDIKVMIKKLQNDIQNVARINSQRPSSNISPVRQPKTTLAPINEQEGKPKIFGLPKRTAEKTAPVPEPIPSPAPDYSNLFRNVPRTMMYYTVLLSVFIHHDKSLLQKNIILPNIIDHRLTGEEMQYIYDNRLSFGFTEDMVKLNPNNPIQVAVYCKYVLGRAMTVGDESKCVNAFKDFMEKWNYGK